MPADVVHDRPTNPTWIVLAVVLAFFGFRNAWGYAQRSFGFDFYQFWVVGQEIRVHKGVNVYTSTFRIETGERYFQLGHSPPAGRMQAFASEQRRELQTYSTPLLYAFFSLIGTSDYAQSLRIFHMIVFASGIAAIVIICRVLEYSWAATILAVGLLWGWGQPYLSDLLVGNVNQLEMLLVAILLYVECRMSSSRRDYLGGAILALMVTFKPNLALIPALLGLMWIAERRWRVLGRHALAGLVCTGVLVVASGAYFGSMRAWAQWLPAFGELLQHHRAVIESNNCSLVQYVREARGATAGSIVRYAIMLSAIAVIAVCRWRAADKQPSRRATFAVIGLGCALPLLTSPISWLHYFVLATPLILLAGEQSGRDRATKTQPVVPILILALAIFAMSYSMLTGTILRMDDPRGTAVRMILGTVALCGWGLFQLRPERPESAA